MPVDQISFERANIQIWERINLIVFEEGRSENYTSRIHDITPTEVVISTPMRSGVEVPLLNNAVVRVIIPCEAGFYSFSTVVLKKTISGVSAVHLQRPEVIERNQRRNYLRIPISLPVTYVVLQPEDENGDEGGEKETREEPLRGTTIHLGGGGVC
ncbi:MAG: flagellar brake domain-containing protein, partial [Candidatus Latescibacteria bacterium]|nr:flagellar brake domain-containing protein [Candidatus Latescibacterota bacterium]